MALHTNLHLKLGVQPTWIHNAGAKICRPRSGAGCRSNVLASRPVTSLAIDAFGQVAEENRIAARVIVSLGYSRIAVVTKHAFVGDETAGPRMIVIRARRHGPASGGRTWVRVPAQG